MAAFTVDVEKMMKKKGSSTADGFGFGSSSSSSSSSFGDFLSSLVVDSMLKEEKKKMKKKAASKASETEDDSDDDKEQQREADARFKAVLKDMSGRTVMKAEEGEKLMNLLKKRGVPSVKQDRESLTLRMEMAGLGKEHVKVSVVNQTLVIKAADENENDENDGTKCSLSMFLPERLFKSREMKAMMKNGVLTVVIPKQKLEERKDAFHVVVED